MAIVVAEVWKDRSNMDDGVCVNIAERNYFMMFGGEYITGIAV